MAKRDKRHAVSVSRCDRGRDRERKRQSASEKDWGKGEKGRKREGGGRVLEKWTAEISQSESQT